MKGQSWSLDFAIGLLFFLLAIAIGYGMFMNAFNHNNYSILQTDAYKISNMLMSEGYPLTWDSNDVIVPGILNNKRLSLRKLEELKKLDTKNFFNTNNFVSFFITNMNDSIIPIRNDCYIGDDINVSIGGNATIKKIAYITSSSSNLLSWATNNSADHITFDQLYDNRYFYDVIIFENPEFNKLLSVNLTKDQLYEKLNILSSLGPTIILIGDLGMPVFGVNSSPSNSDSTIINEDSSFDLEKKDINFTNSYNLTILPNTNLLHNLSISEDNSILSWQDNDAKIYYFGSTNGLYNSQDWLSKLESGLTNISIRSDHNCNISVPSVKNLVKVQRLILDKGKTRKLIIYLWNNND